MTFLTSFSLLESMALALVLQVFLGLWILWRQAKQRTFSEAQTEKIQQAFITQLHQVHLDLQQSYQASQHHIQEKMTQGQLASQQLISDTIQRQMTDVREQMNHSFKQHASSLTSHLQSLTEEIRNHLHSLTQQVNHKLTEGFEKTSSTFTDVVRRLTIIDEAQKKLLNYQPMSLVCRMC